MWKIGKRYPASKLIWQPATEKTFHLVIESVVSHRVRPFLSYMLTPPLCHCASIFHPIYYSDPDPHHQYPDQKILTTGNGYNPSFFFYPAMISAR
jgi:hypothetical protein